MRNKEFRKYKKFNVDKFQKYYEKIAKISFAVFLFSIFFGTSLPFRERTRDIEEITTSNPLNQLVFGLLFIISIVMIYSKKSKAIEFIKREKFLFIFLAWCFLTILWSEYPFVSFKRYIQFFTAVSIPLSYFLYVKESEKAIQILYYILAAYVLVSLATIFTIPMARNEYGFWRGIHTDKNGFGQISLILFIFFYIYIPKCVSLKSKVINVFFISASFVLLIGSRSSTPLLTFIILFVVWILFQIDKLFEPIGIRKTLSIILTVCGIGLIFSILLVLPEQLEAVIGVTGKDLSFTGRAYIWKDIWVYVQDHFFLGAGYQGFWIINSPSLEELYQTYIWLPTQSHNGYLDILNEVGAIGAFLFLLLIINYFVNLSKLKIDQPWKWFVFAAIILNITESKFMSGKAPTAAMFIISYLALFKDSLTLEELAKDGKAKKSDSANKYSPISLRRRHL